MSVTAGQERGVSLKKIIDTAGWSRRSTFEAFYNAIDFTEAVLGEKEGMTHSLNNTLT